MTQPPFADPPVAGRALPVTLVPVIGETRTHIDVPMGRSVQDIVRLALPAMPESAYHRVRVWLVSDQGMQIVAQESWRWWRPREGVRILLRLVPAKNALKAALGILVTIAAAALGQFWLGPLIASTFGIGMNLAVGIATAALSIAGNFLLGMVFKPEKADQGKEKPNYQLAGWQNEARPDQPVPVIMGRHRYATTTRLSSRRKAMASRSSAPMSGMNMASRPPTLHWSRSCVRQQPMPTRSRSSLLQPLACSRSTTRGRCGRDRGQ